MKFCLISFQLYEYKVTEKEENIDYISSDYTFYTYFQIGFTSQKISELILSNESNLKIEGNKCNIKSNFELEKSISFKSYYLI